MALTAQSSFGSDGAQSLVSPPYHAPHRQRLLLFRYSRMNQKNGSGCDSYIRQPLVSSDHCPKNVFTRTSSISSPPVAPPRRFNIKKEAEYQTMVEDNSIDDSDGSNITSITTTTTGE